jgi:hypothetical protein
VGDQSTISVVDPRHIDADLEPDPTYHFYADLDPDPTFHFDTDPDPPCHFDADPTFHFDADPDPSFQIKAQIKTLSSANCFGSGSSLYL